MKRTQIIRLIAAIAAMTGCSREAESGLDRRGPSAPRPTAQASAQRTSAEQERVAMETTIEPLPAGLTPQDVAAPAKGASTYGREAPADVIPFVRTYLRRTYGDDALPGPISVAARAAEVGPNSRTMVFAYVGSRDFCGTGGCVFLILEPRDGTWKVLGDVSTHHLPVRVLETRSHGYPDIGVTVAGGGIMVPYEIPLHFDGAHYPRSPFGGLPVHPHRLPPGRVVLNNDDSSVELPPASRD